MVVKPLYLLLLAGRALLGMTTPTKRLRTYDKYVRLFQTRQDRHFIRSNTQQDWLASANSQFLVTVSSLYQKYAQILPQYLNDRCLLIEWGNQFASALNGFLQKSMWEMWTYCVSIENVSVESSWMGDGLVVSVHFPYWIPWDCGDLLRGVCTFFSLRCVTATYLWLCWTGAFYAK